MWRCNNTALGGLGTSFVVRTAIRTFVTLVCVNRDVCTLYAGAGRAVTTMHRFQSCVCTLHSELIRLSNAPPVSDVWCISKRSNIKLPNRKRYKHDDTDDIANLKNVKGGVI